MAEEGGEVEGGRQEETLRQLSAQVEWLRIIFSSFYLGFDILLEY